MTQPNLVDRIVNRLLGNDSPADIPPAEELPIDELPAKPPHDVPPAEEPPAEEPPADVPAIEEPPKAPGGRPPGSPTSAPLTYDALRGMTVAQVNDNWEAVSNFLAAQRRT